MGEARKNASNVNLPAHLAVFFVGVVLLAWLAAPVTYDGLVNTDGFATAFLLIAGLFLAGLGGAAEGALARLQPMLPARAALIGFSLLALWPPALMSGQWFPSSDSEGSSSSLGLAIIAWTVTVGLQYLCARRVNGLGGSQQAEAVSHD